MKFVKGNVRKILFESENGYKVGLFKVVETNIESEDVIVNKVITFTGSFMPLNNEVTYIFYGCVVNHIKYGKQFSVNSYDVCAPSDKESVVLYLSSDLFKGIGKKTAQNIVDEFGIETINEVKNGNVKLSFIKGMNASKAAYLRNRINELEGGQDLIISLNTLGFSTKESINIVNKHHSDLAMILKDNIYLLNDDVDFLKLDKIFLRTNDEFDSVRINALIKYSINNLCYKTGDTYVLRDALYLEINKYFTTTLSVKEFDKSLDFLEGSNIIIIIGDKVCLYDYYAAEKNISDRIKYLNDIKCSYNRFYVNDIIADYEKNNNIIFNDKQKDAIVGSINNNLFIITGGPGTGKTTVIKAIVEIYKTLSKCREEYISLLAPTGRASKRMAESVGLMGSTIHKFLKWSQDASKFMVNEDNTSKSKLVIVDEVSMVDIFLFSSLLNGLNKNVKLVLIGDANQLPSISPGNVLNDLLQYERINCVYLTEIYRTKKDSYIYELSKLIKNKEIPDFSNKYSDFKFVCSDEEDILKYMHSIIKSIYNKGINVDNFQVLAPMYKGLNGIDNLNKIMQEVFNPESDAKVEISIGTSLFREGDKVIQLVNDAENNIFNGDIGYINKIILGKEAFVDIDFMGNIVRFNRSKFDEFSLAYAISIHKSQGSEYDNVVVIVSNTFKRMLYNKLIYTAVSRAKKSLVIIGDENAFKKAILIDESENKLSLLRDFM